ncbi:TetR/AcrR family transcriptional regulator [Paenibacillus sp. NPDC058071]|uniref:TetR/AcrR family transcriptional regulator n=1 Tax=Paenibacillus sp. NPDC058071 TaxID=3346326 RepID=UPI0036DE6619
MPSRDKQIPLPAASADKKSSDPYNERILEAARELIKMHGLQNVSMYSIAKRAGIGQGSLYRRFTDKGEICSALLLESTSRFLTELEQGWKESFIDRTALEGLQNCIEQVIHFIDQHAELLHLIKSEFVGKKQLTQFEHPLFQRMSVIMTDLLSQAADNGEIVDIDPHFTVTALLAVLSPDTYVYQQKAYGSSQADITKGILTLFVDGLSKNK